MARGLDIVAAELAAEAGLVPAGGARPMLGRGFDNDVALVDLVDGDPVVLRRFREPRAPEGPRAAFLDGHQLPAPRLLAASAEASLVEFVPGRLLGDLIETGDADDVVWRAVGRAYRQVHDVVFPQVWPVSCDPTGSCCALSTPSPSSTPSSRPRSTGWPAGRPPRWRTCRDCTSWSTLRPNRCVRRGPRSGTAPRRTDRGLGRQRRLGRVRRPPLPV